MPPSSRPRQNEKVRLAILNATMTLAQEVGYDKLTIEGIAKRAGAGKQTIYRWWSSKALVLLEALVENVHPQLKFTDTGDLRADLLAQMQRVAQLMSSPDTGCAFLGLLVEAQFDPEVAQAMNDQIFTPTYIDAAARIRSAQKAGQLRADADPVMLVELLYAPLYYRLIVPFAQISLDDIPVFLDLTLSGLAPAPPQAVPAPR